LSDRVDYIIELQGECAALKARADQAEAELLIERRALMECTSSLQSAIHCIILKKKEVEDYHECDYEAGQWDTAEAILEAIRNS
jgi:hypothetical protein